MGTGRERFADMIENAVSFGVARMNITGSRVSGQSRKRESPEFLRHTAAGKRVQHALTAPRTGLTYLIRHSERPLNAILRDWAAGLEQDHANKVQASGDSGGTVMENATVAMYNGGYLTLGGFTKQVPFGRDGRIWLVYHALGGPVIEEGDIRDLLKATGGHHKTGEYKMSDEKRAQREHDRILEQLHRVIPRALELEAKLNEKSQVLATSALEFVQELKSLFEERQREKPGGETARTAETRNETPPKAQAAKPKAPPKPKDAPAKPRGKAAAKPAEKSASARAADTAAPTTRPRRAAAAKEAPAAKALVAIPKKTKKNK